MSVYVNEGICANDRHVHSKPRHLRTAAAQCSTMLDAEQTEEGRKIKIMGGTAGREDMSLMPLSTSALLVWVLCCAAVDVGRGP